MIYSKLVVNGSEVTDAYNYIVKKSVVDNNSSSFFRAHIENYAGRHSEDFSVSQDVKVYKDNNLILPGSTPSIQILFNSSGATFTSDVGSLGLSGNNLLWTSGIIGSAVGFNGNNSSINGGSISVISGNSPFTVSFWANLSPTGSRQWVAMIGSDVTNNGIHFLVNAGTTGSTQFGFFGGVQNQIGYGQFFNNWTHIATTYSGGNISTYLNGNLKDLQTTATPSIKPSYFYIGSKLRTGAECHASGIIDDFRIYSYALNASEVKSLYNNGSGNESLNNGSQLLFNGLVEQIDYTGKGLDEKITIDGRDYAARLIDRTVEPEVYTNWEVGSIVRDIITKYTTDIGSTFVETTTTTLPRIAFRHIPVYDALRQLADLTTYTFYVDENRQLHFTTAGSVSSGYTFTAGSNLIEGDFLVDRESVYNQVWVYGDRYLDGYKQTFTAGSPLGGSVFTLTYNPHNTEVTVSGTSGTFTIQPGNIQNVNFTPPSGTKYLVGYDDKTIVFTSGTNYGHNIPASGQTITVNYKRSLPIVKVGDDETSKAAYSQRTKVTIDKDIKDPQTAQSIMESQLLSLNKPAIEGNLFLKGNYNLTPGQTAIINMPHYSISGQTYVIIGANYEFNKENNLAERVTDIKLNRRIGDVSDIIKKMMIDIKKLQAGDISDQDIITRFQYATGSLGLRTSGVQVWTRGLGSSFILGKGYHGVTGPTFGGILGSITSSGISFLGDSRTGSTLAYSGGYF